MSNCAQITKLPLHTEVNCIGLPQCTHVSKNTHTHSQLFFFTHTREDILGILLYLGLFSHLSAACSVYQPGVAYRWELRLYSHLQHFLKVPIQIPTRIISSLHSDVLPFILALYYCQLSPVLWERRKRISSAFPLAQALHWGCKSVSPRSSAESAQCHPCNASGHNGHLLVIAPFPAVAPSEWLKFLYNISNPKSLAVQ